MKLTLNKNEFAKALVDGGSFAGTNKVIPILDCVKIKVMDGTVGVTSSNATNAMYVSCSADSGEDGAFCVPYKELMSYIKLMDDDTFTMNVENGILHIGEGYSSFSMPVYGTDEFPVPNMDGGYSEVEVPSDVLTDFISTGSDFISTDSLRPVLGGIYFYSDGSSFGYCATDSAALAHSYVPLQSPTFDFILDRCAFASVLAVARTTDYVKIRVGNEHALFIGNKAHTLSSFVKGRYPNFRSVIPSLDNSIKATVDCKKMERAVNRCAIAGDRNIMSLRLTITEQYMEMTCENLDMLRKATEKMAITATGEITIGVKKDYISLVLKHMGGKKAKIDLTGTEKPLVVRDAEVDNNQLYLMMPLYLS